MFVSFTYVLDNHLKVRTEKTSNLKAFASGVDIYYRT